MILAKDSPDKLAEKVKILIKKMQFVRAAKEMQL